MLEEMDMVRDTTRLRTQALGFALGKYLCIMVAETTSDDAVRIPATSPYVATKTLVAGTAGTPMAAFPPGPVIHPLGYIMRNGTTVHLPYLTQFANYNQRIVVVNRGGAASYTFSFMAEDGVTVTEGSDASGMLPANSSTYFSMQFGNLVTIDGSPNRAAGTLIIESQPSFIDVLVSQTNANGGTDTVNYTPRDPSN